MTIGTKFLRGKFYCYATVDGFDCSFDGNTVVEAQIQMRELIDKKYNQGKISGNVEWEAIQVIEEPKQTVPEPPYIGYASMRIDHNPFA
jgi:hypothetical protein